MKQSGTTRAIMALVEIISDEEIWIGRRIEATEGLLAYEAPLEVVEAAKEFLTSIFEDSSIDLELRLGALKLMRRAEAKKVIQATATASDEHARREVWRRVMIANRRVRLVRAGLWPAPNGWSDDLRGDGFVSPGGSFFDLWRRVLGLEPGPMSGAATTGNAELTDDPGKAG